MTGVPIPDNPRRRVRIGVRVNILPLLLAAPVITAVYGGPWWVPLASLVVPLLAPLYSLLGAAVLVYLTWGSWWVAAPVAAFVFASVQRWRLAPSRQRVRGLRYHALYVATGRLRYLRRSIKAFEQAVFFLPPYDPNRALCLAGYASSLLALHQRTGQTELLDHIEQLCREALADLPADHPHRGVCATELSTVLATRYAETNDTALLTEVIRLRRDAVAAPHADHDKPALLANLGTALMMQYERTEEPEILAEVMRAYRDAIAADSPPSAFRHGLLSNLGSILMLSYSVNGELAALEEAVEVDRAAVAAMQPGFVMRDSNLANLAGTLLLLFERTGQVELANEAAGLARDAVAACPPDHPDLHSFLGILGAALWTEAEHGDRPDLADEAVTVLRKARAVLPNDHSKRIALLPNLCAALVTAYAAHHRPTDLADAVRAGREAVAGTPQNHPGFATTLYSLGRALAAEHDRSGDPAVLTEAARTYAEAARAANAPPVTKVDTARKAAELYLRAHDSSKALAMAEFAVAQIPKVAPQRLGRDDREHRAVSLAGLATTAAEAAIAAGRPGRAVELLEQARGIVLSGTFDLRGDLADLRSRAPGMARELDDLRRAIEDASLVPGATLSVAGQGHEVLSELRTQLNQQWDELLTRIRRQPGFRDFLQPPRIGQLREQAAAGPIVCIVAHRQHGSALIVSGDSDEPVVIVDLPLLTEQAVNEKIDELREAQRAAAALDVPTTRRKEAQQDTLGVLAWLWDAAAAPVLKTLGHTGPRADGEPWQRIWWCPVGLCAFLPLHAAGHHDEGTHDTVMDRVVSSYTSTIRMLAYARSRRHDPSEAPTALVVSVPDAPDVPPLPGTVTEADLLSRLLPATRVLPSPDHAAVTDALSHHEIAHFACHSVADLRAPAGSRLLLRDHLEHPFTIGAISRLRLDRGELAYLSACSTTDTGQRHADEAVHVTAAFQLAGYRSVVGTLWPINDRAATTVAEDFYTHLFRPGTASLDPATAATALHHAVHAHRARYPALPLQWASHIHHGP
jgi:tetratricopeptide (TPR) repeat protein